MKEDIILSERIDRNGTKHQEVETACDRCGGAGQSRAWVYTGCTCYKCGGHGRRTVKRKIYTPEHEAKLKKQRDKREEKKQKERMEKRIAEIPVINEKKLQEWGFQNLHIYAVQGNTYKIRESLRRDGAKYSASLNWYFSVKPTGYPTVKLDIMDLITVNEYGEFFLKEAMQLVEIVNNAKGETEPKSKTEMVSEYVGAVGDMVELDLKFLKSFTFDGEFGWTAINRLQDENGNVIVWKTGRDLEDEVNEAGRITLRGKIKEHSKYDGVKQTVLTRCKVLEK
ncbi:hypothetical protein [Bacillus thuringiensis]|uniref:hypothetical protein n=1 Tax=Bacillus thuringiensis TaxID=1428 RepID=UPI000BFD84D3|nr:hypothetical protein [Bacillus thuringiensis]PGT89832.1 hypothetical protein COD17_08775 [Bacillus thuringiensis]